MYKYTKQRTIDKQLYTWTNDSTVQSESENVLDTKTTTTYIHSITYHDDQKKSYKHTLTLDFRGLAHPVMVLVEGTILDKGQQYWTKDNNTGKEQQQYRTKDKTRQRKTTINLSILTHDKCFVNKFTVAANVLVG